VEGERKTERNEVKRASLTLVLVLVLLLVLDHGTPAGFCGMEELKPAADGAVQHACPHMLKQKQ